MTDKQNDSDEQAITPAVEKEIAEAQESKAQVVEDHWNPEVTGDLCELLNFKNAYDINKAMMGAVKRHPIIQEINSLGWNVSVEKRAYMLEAYGWTRDRRVSQDAITTSEFVMDIDNPTADPAGIFTNILESIKLYYEDHPAQEWPLNCTNRDSLTESIKQFVMCFDRENMALYISDADARVIEAWGDDQIGVAPAEGQPPGTAGKEFAHRALYDHKQLFGHPVIVGGDRSVIK